MKRQDVVALLSGLIFAIGLGVAGMTDPRKVQGFLDLAGRWDPSLAMVMLGAIGVHFLFARRAKPATKPLLGGRFVLPYRSDVDKRLLLGAALFGLGWGIAGLCPGPGLVSLVTLTPKSIVFVGAMLFGMVLHVLLVERRTTGELSSVVSVPREDRGPGDVATE